MVVVRCGDRSSSLIVPGASSFSPFRPHRDTGNRHRPGTGERPIGVPLLIVLGHPGALDITRGIAQPARCLPASSGIPTRAGLDLREDIQGTAVGYQSMYPKATELGLIGHDPAARGIPVMGRRAH